MVNNLHLAPSCGIINKNHPVSVAYFLGMAALVRVALIRVLRARVSVRKVCVWKYSIRQYSARSPSASTYFSIFLLIFSKVCGFFGIFTVFQPLMVPRSIFPWETFFSVFSSKYLLFTRYLFLCGRISQQLYTLIKIFSLGCTIKSSTTYPNLSV